jgi:hypothetical protein
VASIQSSPGLHLQLHLQSRRHARDSEQRRRVTPGVARVPTGASRVTPARGAGRATMALLAPRLPRGITEEQKRSGGSEHNSIRGREGSARGKARRKWAARSQPATATPLVLLAPLHHHKLWNYSHTRISTITARIVVPKYPHADNWADLDTATTGSSPTHRSIRLIKYQKYPRPPTIQNNEFFPIQSYKRTGTPVARRNISATTIKFKQCSENNKKHDAPAAVLLFADQPRHQLKYVKNSVLYQVTTILVICSCAPERRFRFQVRLPQADK